jgi:N-methylhydantoinase B
MRPDAFTLSIIHSAMVSASEEMFTVTARTARSPIIYDVLDFSTAITDANGDVTAQALACPVFIGVLDFNVRAVLAKYGDRLYPGDLIIVNDPYVSGTHLNDVAVVMPVFYQDRLVAFTASKGHWNDVGGATFGSWGPGKKEIYEEGLQLPILKLYEAGVLNSAITEIIRANSRLPEYSIGDLEAQVAGLRVGGRRIQKIIEKYGLEAYSEALRHILASGQRLAQKGLQRLPHGRFEAHDFLDEGGPGDSPLPVHVTVEISDQEFRVDFSGNAPQLASSLNNTFPGTVGAVRIVYMALIDPHARYNQGFVDPLRVIAPEATIFNAVRPAPVSVYWEVLTYAADLVWKALAPAASDRLTAGHFLSVVGEIVAGVDDRTGEPFALVEPNPGGWGAAPDRDGESALVSFADGETFASSVEVIENRYPIVVERYSLRQDSAGAGLRRGGFGIVKDYRIENSSAEFTTDINRAVVRPWAMEGGGEGTLNTIEIRRPDAPSEHLRKASARTILRGTVISIQTGGGGGYGAPCDREPESVLQDIRAGLITPAHARTFYGLVLTSDGAGVDADATASERARLRSRP